MISGTVAATENCDKAIIDIMMKTYELDSGSYAIEILSNQLRVSNPNPANLTIKPITQKEPLGLFSVIGKVIENDVIIETGQIRMRIKKYAEVLVVTDRFKRHEIFADNRVEKKKMDITNLIEQPLGNIDEIDGYRSKRNIKKGSILTLGNIEPVPDIEQNMETLIVYNDGLCKITAPGIALQTGVAGDYIKVRNKATRKVIIARIVSEKAVAIDP